MKEYELENLGNTTKIVFKGRILTGIKLPKRSGAGKHDSRPKRQRTRGDILRHFLNGEEE